MGDSVRNNRILFFGVPAYGHVFSNVWLAKRLHEEGFQVIYYSLEPFRRVLEANGCEFRAYPIDREALDLSDGEKILKLYRLILQYTEDMLPELLRDARNASPCAVIFDSLALWGRAIARLLSVPSVSFYSIAAIDWKSGAGMTAYADGFLAGFFRYAGELPRALRLRRRLKRKYNVPGLGLLPALMNKGDRNLCGYSRLFQPQGERFGAEYRFLGPLSVHRNVVEENDFALPEKPFVYISLGTVFNRDEKLLKAVIEQFGAEDRPARESGAVRDSRNSGKWDYQVVLVRSPQAGEKPVVYPDNFIVKPFVNQNEILARASLFISAGGMNSIHEALYYGVPCLLCPQQGEQLLNAKRFEKLGFGRILRGTDTLRQEAEECMKLKNLWDEEKRRQMLRVSVRRTIAMFREFQESDFDVRDVDT